MILSKPSYLSKNAKFGESPVAVNIGTNNALLERVEMLTPKVSSVDNSPPSCSLRVFPELGRAALISSGQQTVSCTVQVAGGGGCGTKFSPICPSRFAFL